MNALILNARLRQEIGEFPNGDKALQEIREIIEKNEEELEKISAERVLYYKAKGIHIQAKNYARQLYHQKSCELFNEGLEFLKSDTSFPNIRVKFTCKLLEGLGHLMCEPLMFDICEKHLSEAQTLYDKNIDTIFSKHDRIRFQIKKSSFLKKYGFFIEALELLGNI